MVFDYFLVVVLALLAGGWAIPSGISFGLEPVGVFMASTLGAVGWMGAALLIGGRTRDTVKARFASGPEASAAGSRARRMVDRWGPTGLATIGIVLVGPTVTVITALALDLDRRRFFVWSSVATITMYAALTILWSAVL